jgi:hypothetical protein
VYNIKVKDMPKVKRLIELFGEPSAFIAALLMSLRLFIAALLMSLRLLSAFGCLSLRS